MKKYITTAIPYVNSIPHVGFALEIVETDVLARFYRQIGFDVNFVTGTDENSFKIARSAIEQGISPKELVDANSQKFYELKDILNISFDDFIRTTESRHFEGTQKLWKALNPEDIYVKKWDGWYCIGCEAHYQKEELLIDNKCPEHFREVEHVIEDNYFFKFGKYKEKLKKLIENKQISIIPESRRQEVLNLLNQFHDFNISRYKKYNWGIDVPGDNSQIIYPWIDALSNYINAVGYAYDNDKFQKWWADDKVEIIHVIGKGITKFHAIYWPTILLSAGIRLPNKIFVHGHLTIKGRKISKSLGNVISPNDIVAKYGTDATRYFLLREFSPWDDGDFTYEKFEERYNADLAKGLGNLFSRVLTLAQKGKISPIGNPKFALEIKKTEKELKQLVLNFKFNEALEKIWRLIALGDKYIDAKKPWSLEPKSKEFKKIIGELLFLIAAIGKLLVPFLPETADKISKHIAGGKNITLFPRVK